MASKVGRQPDTDCPLPPAVPLSLLVVCMPEESNGFRTGNDLALLHVSLTFRSRNPVQMLPYLQRMPESNCVQSLHYCSGAMTEPNTESAPISGGHRVRLPADSYRPFHSRGRCRAKAHSLCVTCAGVFRGVTAGICSPVAPGASVVRAAKGGVSKGQHTEKANGNRFHPSTDSAY